jgi:hypothetical protein
MTRTRARAVTGRKFGGVGQRKIVTFCALSPVMRRTHVYVGLQFYAPGRGVTADAVPHFSLVGLAGAAAGP